MTRKYCCLKLDAIRPSIVDEWMKLVYFLDLNMSWTFLNKPPIVPTKNTRLVTCTVLNSCFFATRLWVGGSMSLWSNQAPEPDVAVTLDEEWREYVYTYTHYISSSWMIWWMSVVGWNCLHLMSTVMEFDDGPKPRNDGLELSCGNDT